jgi:aminopeptidase-like protein/aminoglycoside N3'-acetyltransferase
MTNTAADNTREGLVQALRDVGLATGNTAYVHVNLGALGPPAGSASAPELNGMLLSALEEVVGTAGTILVPTYTFSFCRQEPFDVQKTPTAGGDWSPSADFLEFFRTRPGTIRSRDPIHSVAGRGPGAGALLRDVAPTCFGPGSVHERLLEARGKIVLIGLPLEEATFRHHVEEVVGLPARFRKLFTGVIRDGGVERKQGWLYFVRALADACYPDGRRLEARARETGICRASRIGRGEVLGVSCRDYFDLTKKELGRDPWLTVRGPKTDVVAAEAARVGRPLSEPSLPPNASMEEMVSSLWRLPRDIVSDGYDAALRALSKQLPMTIHEYPSGSECWTWIVPEKWTCHEAWLETMDGRRLFSYADHPLHVVSYSLPFEGVVSRDELFRHLHVHPKEPEAIPFIFKYYERDWGLCCNRRLKESLTDDRYRVVIRTDFSYGTLKVGEVVAPGESDEAIYLCSHLCHPAMFNDDLSGVVVGMDVMRRLLQRPIRRYTYRYLIVPETIGGVAYLAHNEALVPRMKGGLFLEMLGLDQPHALQLSFGGSTELDELWSLVLKGRDPYGWTGAFRTVIGNDERQFNGPGVRVPMLSLSRVLPPTSPDWPYRQYHSSLDNPSLGSIRRLEESRDLVLSMIDALEENSVPVNRFKGEAFCSRYGLFVDGYSNPQGHRAFFDILFLIDGTRSVARIARECGITFDAARGVLDELARHGLVEHER